MHESSFLKHQAVVYDDSSDDMWYSQPLPLMGSKSYLVTGGTGTFGHTIVPHLLSLYDTARVIVYSRDELKQHQMRAAIPDKRLEFFIGDVRDRDRLRRAFESGLDAVIHAAALKQVPACEYQPYEAVKTNIIGAQNVVDAAIDTGVGKVVALSSDKACDPANTYGTTKAVAERIFTRGNIGKRTTRFCCVRYGNVLGSRGSFVEVIERQRASGKISVTDPEMTRFWMSIEDAVGLVMTALSLMRGGEIFVPKIKALPVLELVRRLAPECDVELTGIRAGEKLHETLISEHEIRRTVDLGEVYAIEPEGPQWQYAPHEGRPVLLASFSSRTAERMEEACSIAH